MTRREADAIELSGVEPFYQEIARTPTDDEIARLEAFNEIYNLVSRYGEERVVRWALNAGRFLNGEAL